MRALAATRAGAVTVAGPLHGRGAASRFPSLGCMRGQRTVRFLTLTVPLLTAATMAVALIPVTLASLVGTMPKTPPSILLVHVVREVDGFCSRLQGGYRWSWCSPKVSGAAHRVTSLHHRALIVRARLSMRRTGSKPSTRTWIARVTAAIVVAIFAIVLIVIIIIVIIIVAVVVVVCLKLKPRSVACHS